MSDMELEEIVGEKLYNPKDVVWVKLSGMWWPAEVQDQATLDPEVTEGLKKPLLCVVQFLLESSYLHIKSLDQIYHYNCKKKMEFLKLGFKKYFRNKNEKNVSIWPDVIQEAERRTGGNPDIINDPGIVPVVEKPEGAVSKAGSSGKRQSLPVGSRRGQGSRHSLPANHCPGPSVNGSRQQARRHTTGGSGRNVKHVCVTLIQRRPPVDNVPQPPPVNCQRCDFVSPILERYLLHYRMNHLYTGRRMPAPVPRFIEPGPSGQSKPKIKKQKKRKEETGTPPIAKRKKKSVVTTKETTPQPKKDEPPSMLEVSQECEQILKDWDDEDDDMKEGNRTSPSKDVAIDDNSLLQAVENDCGAQVGKNGASNDTSEKSSKNAELRAPPPPKTASCFDFDDEESAQPDVQTLKFGQKLPRVISPEKPKSSIADILSDGRELECFLNEVSVPQLPTIPSVKEGSLKEQKGGKKSSVFSPAKGSRRGTTETKEGIVGNQDLDDKNTVASEDGRIKSEEKHFLVEGPLQSKKRKGSGLTEGAEDGSAGKKQKIYGNVEPSKKNDLQLTVGDHIENVGGQLDTVPEPAVVVQCKPDVAATVEPSDSEVVESTPKPVKIESQTETIDSIAEIGEPLQTKSTISEFDKQSLIDTLTYSPSSVDTETPQKTKKIVKGKELRGSDAFELEKQTLIDTLTHSPAPLDICTPHKKSEKIQSRKSSRVSRSESSKTPNTTVSRSSSRGKQVDDKTPVAFSRLAKEASSAMSPSKRSISRKGKKSVASEKRDIIIKETVKARKAKDSVASNELIEETKEPNEVTLLRRPMSSSSQDAIIISTPEASKTSSRVGDDYSKVRDSAELEEETSVNKKERGKAVKQVRSPMHSVSRDFEPEIDAQYNLNSESSEVVSPNKDSFTAEAPNEQAVSQPVLGSPTTHEHKQASVPVEMDSKESVEDIAVSQADQPSPKTAKLCSTRQSGVAMNPTCFSEPSVHEIVNNGAEEYWKKESPTLVESKLDRSEVLSSPNVEIKPHNNETVVLPTTQIESKLELCTEQPLSLPKTAQVNKEVDCSSITQNETKFELAPHKRSNEEQEIDKSLTVVQPDVNCALPLKLLEKHDDVAFVDNSLSKSNDIHLVSHGCSESFLPPIECTSGSPTSSDRLIEGNLSNNGSAGELKAIPPSIPSINLIPDGDIEEINNVDLMLNDKSSPVPCDSAPFPTGKIRLQTSSMNISISSEETKLPQVSEKGQKETLELPKAPVVAARASRWDNPFPPKKSESRPLTPTQSLMVSPSKMSRSPVNKVKIEIKSGLGRSCFKSPPPNMESDAKPIQTDVVKAPTAHQADAKTVSLETTVTDQAPDASEFDDELSALRAEIASYSESKLQAHSPQLESPTETKKHDLSRPQGLNIDSTEPDTNVIEGSGKKSQSHVRSEAQMLDLKNSLVFDIPLDSIPLPECPKPEPLMKETPSPSKVPGLSEAALLASLLKGDDDDDSSINNTASVATPEKQSSKPVFPAAKTRHTLSEGVGKLDIKNKSKSNLLSPIVTSLADAPVVISNIPLPLSEPSITSSQCTPSDKSAPIVIPVEPPKVSPQHQVPSKLDDAPRSRVQVLEVECSQPQGGMVGVIDPSKLLDLNDIPFVFEEDLIEEGLMPSEPVQSPLVTKTKSLSIGAPPTESTSLGETKEAATELDSEETFAIEDLVEEVVEEEPATDNTLSGDVVTENDFTVPESTESKIYEARQVRQYIIEVSDDSDPNFDYNCSLPLAPVGKTAVIDQPVPAKKKAKVVPIQPKKMLTERKYFNLRSSTGKFTSASTASSTPRSVRIQTVKSVKPVMTLAGSEKEKVQVASGSTPEVPQIKEPLKLQMFKDATTGSTKLLVNPQMVQHLSKSNCKLILSQHGKNVVKSPGLVPSNTLLTKNPSLIQVNKSPLPSPKLVRRAAAPSVVSRGRSGRQAAPIQRGISIPIPRSARNKGTSEVLVSGNSVGPTDHELILTSSVLPPSGSTNQVLLTTSTNQLMMSSPPATQLPTKFVSFVVNKPPEPKKPSKDLLEQALTGLDVQNDEATSMMPTATVVYGMLADPLQQRPIMTTAVQPSQVILSHDQLLTFQAPKDPTSTVSPSETNR